MLKRSIMFILMLCFIGLPRISGQTLPNLLMENYEGKAIPHTSSGLTNRLITQVMTEFDIEGSKEMYLDQRDGESRFQVEIPLGEDGLSVSFYTGKSTHGQGFYIYQKVASEKVADFETIHRLVNLVDESLSEEAIQEAYDQWLMDLSGTQNFILGGHAVNTYNYIEDEKEYLAFEVMYEYFDTVFEDESVQNIVTTLYDDSTEFPNIYAKDYADNQEEVYVNRVFINRILHGISQTFGFELGEEHLTAMGNTVYYYPEELAEFGRLNEFYIFSGQSGAGSRIEIRFTIAHNDTQTPAINNLEDQRRSFFYFFAKLLDPLLTDVEIEQAFLDTVYEDRGEYRLGHILIQKEGFTDETISMYRLLTFEEIEAVFPDSINTVSKEQASDILLAEDEYHIASAEQLANPDKIYDSYLPYTRLASGRGNAKLEFETLTQEYWEILPNFKAPLTITGKVIASNEQENWLEIKPDNASFFESYYVYTPGITLELSGMVEVTGQNLGVQDEGPENLSILAQSIKQAGELIYQAGGDQNE